MKLGLALLSVFILSSSAFAGKRCEFVPNHKNDISADDAHFMFNDKSVERRLKQMKALGKWVQLEIDGKLLTGKPSRTGGGKNDVVEWFSPFDLYAAHSFDISDRTLQNSRIRTFETREEFVRDTLHKLIHKANLSEDSAGSPFIFLIFKDANGNLQKVGGTVDYVDGQNHLRINRLKFWEKEPANKMTFKHDSQTGRTQISMLNTAPVGEAPLKFEAFGHRQSLDIPFSQIALVLDLRANPYSNEVLEAIGPEMQIIEGIKSDYLRKKAAK